MGIDNSIFLRVDRVYQAVPANEIVYIEAEGDYLNFYLKDDKKVLLRCTMKKIESRLPAQHFLRIHRSYLVNTLRIRSFDTTENTLCLNGTEKVLPLNRKCRERLFEMINVIN